MSVIQLLKKLRDGYVIRQVRNIHFPAFQPSPTVREKVRFSGRVQKIGFRLEIYELAKRLDLVGWVRNNKDKSVEAELQGEQGKIEFLISFMKGLKRASVRQVLREKLPLKEEAGFTLIKEEV